jgi:hypothetical protein
MPADAIILDANLLVLLIVGMASRTYIAIHKRLRAYTERDFDLLTDFLARAARITVTPNTITETSNLVGQVAEPARRQVYLAFRALMPSTDEIYIESKRAAEDAVFPRLGITDSVLLNLAMENRIFLTADLDLYLEASRRDLRVINFNHLIAANG